MIPQFTQKKSLVAVRSAMLGELAPVFVSASRDMNTLDMLLPVSLNDADYAQFVKVFHSRGRNKSMPFIDLASHLTYTSCYVNSILAGLRRAYRLLPSWDADGADFSLKLNNSIVEFLNATMTLKIESLGDAAAPQEQAAQATDKKKKRREKKIASNVTPLPDAVVLEASKYVTRMSTGRHIIIRDSARYPGGKDIVYSGLRGATTNATICLAPSASDYIRLIGASHIVENVSDRVADIRSKIVSLACSLIHALTGNALASPVDSYSRNIKQTDPRRFKSIVTETFNSSALAKSLRLTAPDFVSELAPETSDYLSDFFSAIALFEPSAEVVRARKSHTGADDAFSVNLHAVALTATLCFSFAVNLPKQYVSFITQAKDNEKPSLASLNTWAVTWAAASLRQRNERNNGGLKPSNIPKYVLAPSKAAAISARRKELGLYVEKGRVNQDFLSVDGKGDLIYMPPQDAASDKNSREYEASLEEAISLSFEAGTPLMASTLGATDPLFELAHPEYAKKIFDLKKTLHDHAGSLQAYNWDLNAVITVSESDPDRIVAHRLTGATIPDDLNMARYMRDPFGKSFRNMFSRSRVLEGDGKTGPFRKSDEKDPRLFARSLVLANVVNFYQHLADLKKVPRLVELVEQAKKSMGIESLDIPGVREFELDLRNPAQTIYKGVLKPDLSLGEGYDDDDKIAGALTTLMLVATVDASGASSTNLARYCAIEGLQVEEHERYFGVGSPAHEFENIYKYFGGRVFYHALKALLSVDVKVLQEAAHRSLNSKSVPWTTVMREVMPFAHMFGSYITDKKEAILKRADEIADANANPKVSEEALNVAGSKAPANGKPGMQLFPHQAEGLCTLKNHPKIAIIDVDPGGGKTILLLADMAMLLADGKVSKPFFVICPNGLVGNWVEDMHKITEGRWNVIPVSTATYSEWGDERLTEMISKAPRNTIVVVGNSFLSNTPKQQLVIGNAVESISNAVEFIKKFSPEYLAIDESHRIRNLSSGLHKAVKAINTMSCVKYGRIATGTLIQNVMSDVVGQSAIFSAQMFRTVDDFDEENKQMTEDALGNKINDYTADVPTKIRKRLSEFATVLSYKRKDWAFMLPLPIETFIRVKLENDSGNTEDVAGHAHRMFYDAVLRKTMDELRNNPLIKKLAGKDSAGDDDDENDEDSETAGNVEGKLATKSGKTLDVVTEGDDDSDNLDALEAALQPYLQRLEMLITDPLGDEELGMAAHAFFGDTKRENFVSAKVRKVVERIKYHFTPIPFKKGAEYRSSDLCDLEGKTYILRPDEPIGKTKITAIKEPDVDTENWRLQDRGKVIVFCRYTRTVDAVFRALPAELKKQAVVFHGEVAGNKWENLDRFKNDPRVSILIANEMGISEGHNLQCASRFIRVECPWAPGELSQSAARIFRPDVDGKFHRQIIFLDWIITDGTLEVAKMGRLISKMLKKSQFDELYNTKYYKNLNPRNLPIIRMSLDNIEQLNSLSDLCEIGGDGDMSAPHSDSYIGQYQYLTSECAAEFREMKATRRAYMIDVAPTPMPADSKIIEYTPWTPNLKVPDRNNDGLVSLNALLREEEDPFTVAIKRDPRTIVDRYVRTEFGMGRVVGFTSKRSGDPESTDYAGFSKLRVDLAQGGQVLVGASSIYLALNVTDKIAKRRSKDAPVVTDKDVSRSKGREGKAEKASERSSKRSKKIDESVTNTVSRKKKAVEEDSVSFQIELYPVVYNGVLALEAVTADKDSDILKDYGFSKFDDYAFFKVVNEMQYNSVLDWLEEKFTLDRHTEKRLEMMLDGFQTGRGRKFDVALAPIAEVKQFFLSSHRLVKVTNSKKPELRVYPLVIHGSFYLVVDLATNPVFRKFIGKTVPHASPTVKIQDADGLDIKFFRNKSELMSEARALRSAGFEIVNYDDMKEEVRSLDLKQYNV